MASRTAYAGTAADGDVYTAANHTKMPGGWIGYANVTASQTGIGAEADLTGLTVTVTVGSNRLIRISALVNIEVDTSGTGNEDVALLSIKEGVTYLAGARFAVGAESNDVVDYQSCLTPSVLVVAPSAGSHTYKLSLALASGTATLRTNASATLPAFIMVEDLGPSS